MKPMRVVLADDHALVRAGIRALLERIPGLEVVGEADDGAAALELAKHTGAELLLADIAMRPLGGLETAARAATELPSMKVLILSMHAIEEYVLRALRAGAAGYLLKDSASSELERAIETVQRGQVYLSPAISRTVIDVYAGRATVQPLTPRQLEVLTLIAEGKSVKEIALALDLSVKTVETHRAQLMDRLGIHDVPGLVKYALRTGLIPLGSE